MSAHTPHISAWCILSYCITLCHVNSITLKARTCTSTCVWIQYGWRLEEKRERRRDEKERKEKDKLTEKKCTGTQEHIKKEEAIDSKLGSVSRPRSSSFNGSFMFAGSSITYGRWIGGKDPEEVVCLGNEEVQRSEAEKRWWEIV